MVVAAVTAVVVVEVWLRYNAVHPLRTAVQLAGMFENDADGRMRTVAYYRAEVVVDDRRITIDLNGAGGRGEFPAGSAGSHRILFLGDSIPFGWGVAAEEAFPMLVQRQLRLAEQSVAVGNAGAPSFAPRDFPRSVERWRRAGFAPDTCVLCLYLGNDFADAFTERRELVDGFDFAEPIAKAVRGSWRARLALHSYAWFHFEIFLLMHLPQYGLDLPFAAAAAELAQSQRDLPPLAECHAGILDATVETPVLQRVLQRTVDDLQVAAAACAPARVLVAILPTAWHQPRLYEEYLTKQGWQATHARGTVQQRLASALSALGLAFVDLTPMLCDGAEAEANFLPQDRHLSVIGHARVADVLGDALRRSR